MNILSFVPWHHLYPCSEDNIILDDKTWFFKQRGKNYLKEIANKECTDHYKVWIDDEHKLQLINFEVNDSGIYVCKSRNIEDNDTIFTYVLDGKTNTVRLLNYIHLY